jgi:hypothetical protein
MLRSVMMRASSLGVGVFVFAYAASAAADEGRPPIALDAEPTETPESSAPTKTVATAHTAAESSSTTDHQRQVGHLSLAFHGVRTIPAAVADGAGISVDGKGSATVAIAPDETSVPTFGVRYWVSETVGVDVGLGFGYETGSVSRYVPNPDPTLDRTEDGSSARRTAFAARLAAPLSVHSGKHYNLMVIPGLDVGYTRTTLPAFRQSTTGDALDLRLTGFVFGVGAQVGTEVSFGFLGVPQLSLQTAWGLRLESRKRTGKIGDAETTLSEVGIGTSFHAEPWQWLTGSLSAFYSF